MGERLAGLRWSCDRYGTPTIAAAIRSPGRVPVLNLENAFSSSPSSSGFDLAVNTGRVVERIIADRPHPEQGYRSCLALINDVKRYSAERVEAACGRALEIKTRTTSSRFRSTTRTSAGAPTTRRASTPSPNPKSNTKETRMLDEQTHQKMMEMKMTAMAEAFLELQRGAPSNQRSFAEKVACMMGAEWTVRENRRLARLLRAAKLTHDAAMEDVWTTQGRGITRPSCVSCRRPAGSTIATT